MKIKQQLKLIIVLLIAVNQIIAQNVGINTTGATPNAKTLLDIDATGSSPKGGLLLPRLTTTERNTITAPIPQSLLIFNTTTLCFEAWNQSSASWVAFGCIGCQLPGAFSASAASGITATTFAANWVASAGATTYFLDVATDAAFTTFVSGYNNLNVGNVLTTSVTGLTCATTYYYRLRANNTCGTSVNSNTITVSSSGSTTSGLVGCWKFSGDATDGSGNGNNGTINGATLTTDRFGNANSAYSFNGSTAWINCGTGASLNLTGSLTICAWVKTSATHSNAGIAGRWNANGGGGQEQYVLRAAATNDGYFDVRPSGGQIDPFFTTINNNAWHFIVGSWDGTSAKIYKDGTLIQTLTSSGAIGSFSEPFEIGRYAQGQTGVSNYFNGIIDDIRVYNRALTTCEITRLFNEPTGSTCAY